MSSIETLAEQLRDSGSPVSEADLLTKIVTTLPKQFRVFKSNLIGMILADQNMATLTARLMAEEELNKEHDPESNEASTSAFRVESSATKARTSSSRGRQKRRITCSHCKRTGHMESDCYFLLEKQGLMMRPEC